jgi:hypothetical protein
MREVWQIEFRCLELEIWSFFGVWSLEFGVFPQKAPPPLFVTLSGS